MEEWRFYVKRYWGEGEPGRIITCVYDVEGEDCHEKKVTAHLSPPLQVLDHLTLIKDAKSSRVTQYVKKTLAKKRLSAEKVGGKSATDGDAREAGREAPSYNKPLQSSSQNPKVQYYIKRFLCSCF